MVHEARLRDGAEKILLRPITDVEFAAFDSIYAGTTGTVDQRLSSSFDAIVDTGAASNIRSVISYYQVFLGRQPDAAGLAAWTGRLDSGELSLNELADKFALAGEFETQFAGQSTSDIVTAQYVNVLGRQPDAASLATYIQRLDNNEIDLADLGRLFALSPEATNRLDPFTDAFLVNTANGVQDYSVGQTIFQETVGNSAPTTPTTPTAPGQNNIDLFGVTGPANGTAGRDVFSAEAGDLTSRSNIDGGTGPDTLSVFNEVSANGTAISPRMQNVETVVWTEQTNDAAPTADNNVGSQDEANVELDAGRINGVTRWEDFDSRADLVIEDIRDGNDVDGTFTANLTVAMVSTDPGNVDYATYFDNPVNVTNSATVNTAVISLLDELNASTRSIPNPVNGQVFEVTRDNPNALRDIDVQSLEIVIRDVAAGPDVLVSLDFNREAFIGDNGSYNNFLAELNSQLNSNAATQGIVARFGETTREAVNVDANTVVELVYPQIVFDDTAFGESKRVVDTTFITSGRARNENQIINVDVDPNTTVTSDNITLNIDLDDVGKGSTGGDLLAGAMSTGRQVGDDGTSDSTGIEQFNIRVDRGSALQTINSTNNSLEVVNIVNGRNAGPNNTDSASDEEAGNLAVRGRANPDVTDGPFDFTSGTFPNVNAPGATGTDNFLPGAQPQHDDFGFNDVRFINAVSMIGSVDLTVDLSERIVEKYLDNSDTGATGDLDDVNFLYNLSNGGSDEFFVNMSESALLNAGTASREDFNLRVNGNGGDDTIVTNIGSSAKFLDSQGQDAYEMTTDGEFYPNQANSVAGLLNNNAATITVTGGAGNDSIWTHGWGNATISGGFGEDVVYTDNEGTVNRNTIDAFNNPDTGLTSRPSSAVDEHEQIDYEVGAVWTFNDDNGDDDDITNIQGSTNDGITLVDGARTSGVTYDTGLKVSFFGAGGSANDDTAYTSSVVIPAASIVQASGLITDQVMTQLIKRAINDNEVLNKVLEAVDGPGQSLAVYSKIDGEFVEADLEIDLFETLITNGVRGPVRSTDLSDSGYDTSDSDLTDFQLFGRDSIAESDNIITVRADAAADVTVLSTNGFDDADGDVDGNEEGVLNGASNENLLIEQGQFGIETIFNFGAADDTALDGGEDRFDFQAIDFAANATSSTFSNDDTINVGNDSISIIAETSTNNSEAGVLAAYNAALTTANTTALEHIVIIFDEASSDTDDTDNTGSVYYVANPTGAGATTVEFQGDINLIGTDWDSLNQDNFL